MQLSKKQNEYIVNANEDEATAKSKIPEQNRVME